MFWDNKVLDLIEMEMRAFSNLDTLDTMNMILFGPSLRCMALLKIGRSRIFGSS